MEFKREFKLKNVLYKSYGEIYSNNSINNSFGKISILGIRSFIVLDRIISTSGKRNN